MDGTLHTAAVNGQVELGYLADMPSWSKRKAKTSACWAIFSLRPVPMPWPEEALRRTMEYEKENYRLNFEKLKNLKSQIEHAQHLVERSSLKLQKDFEIWWQDQCDLVEARNARREEYEAYGKKPGTAESVGSSAASTIPTGASIASTSRTSVTNSPVNDKYYEIGNKPRLLPYLESDGYGKVYELFFVFTLCGLSG